MNILLCGVGGQGTVLASKILAQCAATRGLAAHTAETIGMAQRGGSVTSHVRLGSDCYSPLIPLHTADCLIAFEPAEAVRNASYLKPGGNAVVCSRPIFPANQSFDAGACIDYLSFVTENITVVSADTVIKSVGSLKPLNVSLLGAASHSAAIPFSLEELESAITLLLPEKLLEINKRALYANVTK